MNPELEPGWYWIRQGSDPWEIAEWHESVPLGWCWRDVSNGSTFNGNLVIVGPRILPPAALAKS